GLPFQVAGRGAFGHYICAGPQVAEAVEAVRIRRRRERGEIGRASCRARGDGGAGDRCFTADLDAIVVAIDVDVAGDAGGLQLAEVVIDAAVAGRGDNAAERVASRRVGRVLCRFGLPFQVAGRGAFGHYICAGPQVAEAVEAVRIRRRRERG